MIKKFKKVFSILLILFGIFFVFSCNEKQYTVLFDYGHDGIMSSCFVLKGDNVSRPTDPIREKYEFVGWYSDEAYTSEFNFDQSITKDITIYAKWKAYKLYYITYNLNGGECKKLVNDFVDGSKVTLPTPTKENYTFSGWYENDTLVTKLENRDYSLVAMYDAVCEEAPTLRIPRVREEYTEYKDVTYKIVGGVELKMDLYLPALAINEYCPILFLYYGGGWIMGEKEDITFISDIVDYVIDNNIALVVPNYRLASVSQYPGPVEDCLDCIRFCMMYKDSIGFDVNKMGSIGYSAGGYMALLAGMAHNYYNNNPYLKKYNYTLKYIVDMYGPSYYDKDSINDLSFTSKVMLSQFLGTTDFTNPKFESVFASYYINYNTSNVYIVHGLEDELVPYSQSVSLYNALIKLGMKAELHLVSGASHILTAADGYTTTTPTQDEIYSDICRFIGENVK